MTGQSVLALGTRISLSKANVCNFAIEITTPERS